ncbi:MAG: hypothetical protein WBE72_20300 [Terracidiphilus sp.]
MQTSPQIRSNSDENSAGGLEESSRIADRVYQGLTVAAMLLLLVSLWVF